MNDQFLCIHGGISPAIQTLDDIKFIDRFREPPQHGPMCDILWADPVDDGQEIKDLFKFNEVRGCSWQFSFRAASEFLQRNNLLSIIRAHEAQDNGYKMHRKSEETGFPTVITLFSAPNYLDAYGNKAAILRYEDNIMNIRQFNHSPHPYWLPNFMNVFAWSIPFVAEKVAEMLLEILECEGDEEEEVQAVEQQILDKEKRRQQLRAKILLVSKFMRMFQTLRTEHENIVLLKGLSERNTLPKGLLSGGSLAIREAVGDFHKAKAVDTTNEMRPTSPIPEKENPRRSEFQRRRSAASVLTMEHEHTLSSPRGLAAPKIQTELVAPEPSSS